MSKRLPLELALLLACIIHPSASNHLRSILQVAAPSSTSPNSTDADLAAPPPPPPPPPPFVVDAAYVTSINATVYACTRSWVGASNCPLLGKPAPLGTFNNVTNWQLPQAWHYVQSDVLPGMAANIAFAALILLTLVFLLCWRLGICCCASWSWCCCRCGRDEEVGPRKEYILTSRGTWSFKIVLIVLAWATIAMCIYGMITLERNLLAPVAEFVTFLAYYGGQVMVAFDVLFTTLDDIGPILDEIAAVSEQYIQPNRFLNNHLPVLQNYLGDPANDPAALSSSLQQLERQVSDLKDQATAVSDGLATTLPAVQALAQNASSSSSDWNSSLASMTSNVSTLRSAAADVAALATSPPPPPAAASPVARRALADVAENGTATVTRIAALQAALDGARFDSWAAQLQQQRAVVGALVQYSANVSGLASSLAELTSTTTMLASSIPNVSSSLHAYLSNAGQVQPTVVWLINQTRYINASFSRQQLSLPFIDGLIAKLDVFIDVGGRIDPSASSAALDNLHATLQMPASTPATQALLASLVAELATAEGVEADLARAVASLHTLRATANATAVALEGYSVSPTAARLAALCNDSAALAGVSAATLELLASNATVSNSTSANAAGTRALGERRGSNSRHELPHMSMHAVATAATSASSSMTIQSVTDQWSSDQSGTDQSSDQSVTDQWSSACRGLDCTSSAASAARADTPWTEPRTLSASRRLLASFTPLQTWPATASAMNSTLTSLAALRPPLAAAAAAMRGAAAMPAVSAAAAAVKSVADGTNSTALSSELSSLRTQVQQVLDATETVPQTVKNELVSLLAAFHGQIQRFYNSTILKIATLEEEWSEKIQYYLDVRYNVMMSMYAGVIGCSLLLMYFALINCRLGLLLTMTGIMLLIVACYIFAVVWSGVLIGQYDVCYNAEDILLSNISPRYTTLLAYYLYDYGGSVGYALNSAGIIDIDAILAQVADANTQVIGAIRNFFQDFPPLKHVVDLADLMLATTLVKVNDVIKYARYASINPLYQSLKASVCCGLSSQINAMWIATTFGGWCAMAACWAAMALVACLDLLWRDGGKCGWRGLRPRLQWHESKVHADDKLAALSSDDSALPPPAVQVLGDPRGEARVLSSYTSGGAASPLMRPQDSAMLPADGTKPGMYGYPQSVSAMQLHKAGGAPPPLYGRTSPTTWQDRGPAVASASHLQQYSPSGRQYDASWTAAPAVLPPVSFQDLSPAAVRQYSSSGVAIPPPPPRGAGGTYVLPPNMAVAWQDPGVLPVSYPPDPSRPLMPPQQMLMK